MWKLLVALCLSGMLGCQHLGRASDACNGRIVADRLSAEFSLHVRAALEHGGRTQRHEALVQVSPESVTLLGLTPLGTQAYRLTLDASGQDLDDFIGRRLGLDPRLLLDAVARSWIVPRGRRGEETLPVSEERLVATPSGWLYTDAAAVERARVIAEPDGTRVVSSACDYEARLVRIEDRDSS